MKNKLNLIKCFLFAILFICIFDLFLFNKHNSLSNIDLKLVLSQPQSLSLNDKNTFRLYFESKLIDTIVVQDTSLNGNETYLRTNYKTGKYDVYGSVFLDYRNKLDDQNLIIYGHSQIEKKDNIAFTRLHTLTDINVLENNMIIYLQGNNFLNKYEIVELFKACAIQIDDEYIQDDMLPFFYTEYTLRQFERYKNSIVENRLVELNKTYSNNDKFLTLQTCIDTNYNYLIILAKKI